MESFNDNAQDWESQRQQKQDHLVTAVLDKGFNGGEFALFLGKQRESGDNVDMWSMQELIQVVDTYTSTHSLSGEPIGPQYEDE